MSRKSILLLATALVSCLCAASVSAQRSTGSAAPPALQTSVPPTNTAEAAAQQKGASQVSEESADLSITATVTAKELRFDVVPNPTVEFPGKPKRDTVWEADRDNLPRPVEPGVTYRNIGIRLKIASRFADIERIVAEALGEVPVTDEVKPPDNAPSPPVAQPPASTPKPTGGQPR